MGTIWTVAPSTIPMAMKISTTKILTPNNYYIKSNGRNVNSLTWKWTKRLKCYNFIFTINDTNGEYRECGKYQQQK